MLDGPFGNGTKERIIEAATKLFGEKGYHSTSIQEICDRAGVSKGALFHYFKAKDDILLRIHEIIIDYESRKAEEVLQEHPRSSSETLKKLVVEHVESIGRFKPYLTVFYHERQFISGQKFAHIKQERKRYEDTFTEVVKAGIESKEFRQDIDPVLLVKAIFGMCNWSYQWLSPEGPLHPREIGNTFWHLILDGIRFRAEEQGAEPPAAIATGRHQS